MRMNFFCTAFIFGREMQYSTACEIETVWPSCHMAPWSLILKTPVHLIGRQTDRQSGFGR